MEKYPKCGVSQIKQKILTHSPLSSFIHHPLTSQKPVLPLS